MTVPAVLAILTLFAGAPLNLYVTLMLRRLHVGHPNPILRVLIAVWMMVTLVAFVFGLIFVNNDLTPPIIAGDVTKIITRGAILALAVVPALWLLWIYRGDGRAPLNGNRPAADEQYDTLLGAVQENTELTKAGTEAAQKAYHEANSVNLKISQQAGQIAQQADQIIAQGAVGEDTNQKVEEIHEAVVEDKP